MMTNYGKWDKFAADVSDSDNDEDFNTPNVTTIDDHKGKSVEIGPSGYTVKDAPKADDNVRGKVEVLSSSSNVNDTDLLAESKNGSVCKGYSWAQDRHEVILSILIDENVKAKDIKISYVEKVLTISSANRTLVEGLLRYDILTNAERKDDEVSDILDWEIKNKINASNPAQNRRLLEVVMRKKCPIAGAFIWWKNVFLSDETEIDVTKISGRNASDLKNTDNFVQAQKMFLEKVKTMEQVEVDVGESGDEEEEDS